MSVEGGRVRCEIFITGQVLRHVGCQSVFNVLAGSVTVLSVAVTYGEKVNALGLAHVWRQGVAVLIYLVRVLGLVATRGSKREFCDNIESSLLLIL